MENRDNPGPTGAKGTPGSNPVQAGAISNSYEQDFSFRCGDVVNGCDWQTSAASEVELRANVERHGREQHGMKETAEDTWQNVKRFIRRRAA